MQIVKWAEMTDGDTDLVDGYDEVDADSQRKIKKALEDGHVADAEWKGVSYLFPREKVLALNAVPTGCGVQPPRTEGLPLEPEGEERGMRGEFLLNETSLSRDIA